MRERNPCGPAIYPPITSSCPRFSRYLIHAPVRFPGSYKLSLRFPMTPSGCYWHTAAHRVATCDGKEEKERCSREIAEHDSTTILPRQTALKLKPPDC